MIPVGADARTAIPAPALFAMVLPSPAEIPPIVAPGATPLTRIPSAPFGIAATPPAAVPIRFPRMTTPVDDWTLMPSNALPEMTLPSPSVAPTVVFDAADNWIPAADGAPARAAVPAEFVPIRLRRMFVPAALWTSIEATTLSVMVLFWAWSMLSAAAPNAEVPVTSTPILLLRTTVPLADARNNERPPAMTLPSPAAAPPTTFPAPWTVTDAYAGVPAAAVPLVFVPTKLLLSVLPVPVIQTLWLANPLITSPVTDCPEPLNSSPLLPAPAADPSTTTRCEG